MKKNQKNLIIILTITSFMALFLAFSAWVWVSFLPFLIKQDCVIEKVEKAAKEMLFLDLKIKNPSLDTSKIAQVSFGVEELSLKKDQIELVELENFSSSLSFEKIFKKTIILKEIKADNLELKLDKLIKYYPKLAPTKEKSDRVFDYFKANVSIGSLNISYLKGNSKVDLTLSEIELSNEKDYKNILFNSEIIATKKGKKYLDIIASSLDEVKLYQDKIEIEDFKVLINNSKLKLNAKIDSKNLALNAKSPDFKLEDIFKIIQSDLIIENGETMLSPLKNPKGKVLFDVNFENQKLSGAVFVDNTKINIKDLSNIPIEIKKGRIEISPKAISFKDLIGYWGKNKNNEIKIYGEIKDYYKTFDSSITVDTFINNEFFEDYLARLINNTIINISKPTKARIVYKAKNNIMDILFLSKIPKGTDLGEKNSPSSKLISFDRALTGDFHIENNVLDIKAINYYIASNINKNSKIKPVISIKGKMGLDGKLDNIGFSFDREMPSEFLNIFTEEKLFKKGTFKGFLSLKYKNNIPYIISNLTLNNTLIPSRRLFLKHAELISDENFINFCAKGGFKRVKFDFDGKIKNELKAPFIIKDLKLELDKINVEHFLNSLNTDQTTISQNETNKIDSEEDIKDDNYMFNTNLVRIENCDFILNEGNFKDINFSNIKAHLTLDNKGILKVKSNKFNFSEGTSSLDFESDLKNLDHYFKLGVLNINSNIIAKALLNLDKEIDGPASGLIELRMDKDLKLTGDIKFIIKDGVIGKIGLVEYLLKIVSVFRNPIAMVNPITVMDIISIPQGKFDKIQGHLILKDNIVEIINIKSFSQNLTALIRGRYDMVAHDSSIRIYTRFCHDKNSKFEFLRNISLNALANKVQMSSKNDANYYSSELKDLPNLKDEKNNQKAQIFLTEVEGDVEHNNFISSLRKIK